MAIPTAVVAMTVLIAPRVAVIDERLTVATVLSSRVTALTVLSPLALDGACFALPAVVEARISLPATCAVR